MRKRQQNKYIHTKIHTVQPSKGHIMAGKAFAETQGMPFEDLAESFPELVNSYQKGVKINLKHVGAIYLHDILRNGKFSGKKVK
jgi:hypothetical protein